MLVAGVGELASSIRRALLQTLDGHSAEIARVRCVVCQHRGTPCDERVYQRHRNAFPQLKTPGCCVSLFEEDKAHVRAD